MQYETSSPALDLYAKALSQDEMAVFIEAVNKLAFQGRALEDCTKLAWQFVRKDSPDPGDVHVDAPMGSDGKKRPRRKTPEKVPDSENAGTSKAFASVAKVDESLGLVFGWAIVCKIDGVDYFDVQDDHIPEDAMLKASSDFMEHSRAGADMHPRDSMNTFQQEMACGTIVFAFPMTTDIAKSLDIQTAKTGLLIAMKAPPDVLAKFKSGEYSGFSIGGTRLKDEEVGA